MFQIGDTVIGNDKNRYIVTCTGKTGIVVDIKKSFVFPCGYQIALESYSWSGRYWVNPEMFDLYEPHETVSLSEYIMGVQ